MYEGVQGTALFVYLSQNKFFALIKKIILQTLVEIIFRYHKKLRAEHVNIYVYRIVYVYICIHTNIYIYSRAN